MWLMTKSARIINLFTRNVFKNSNAKQCQVHCSPTSWNKPLRSYFKSTSVLIYCMKLIKFVKLVLSFLPAESKLSNCFQQTVGVPLWIHRKMRFILNDANSNSKSYIPENKKENDNKIWKGSGRAYMKVLSQNSPKRRGKQRKNGKDRQWPRW